MSLILARDGRLRRTNIRPSRAPTLRRGDRRLGDPPPRAGRSADHQPASPASREGSSWRPAGPERQGQLAQPAVNFCLIRSIRPIRPAVPPAGPPTTSTRFKLVRPMDFAALDEGRSPQPPRAFIFSALAEGAVADLAYWKGRFDAEPAATRPRRRVLRSRSIHLPVTAAGFQADLDLLSDDLRAHGSDKCRPPANPQSKQWSRMDYFRNLASPTRFWLSH